MKALGIKNSSYLILPAYILGTVGIFASHYLLPLVPGMVIAAVLLLAMLSVLSLLHSGLDNEAGLHIALYCFVCVVAFYGAKGIFPLGFGPTAIADVPLTWVQIAFLTIQQMVYFGIHAFKD